MLAFIVPLKSARVSTSWPHVCGLFERTLKSICNQTQSDFKAIVVCHERPEIQFTHPQVTYVEVDFPIPEVNYASREQDKMRKMLIGAMQAKALHASHVMFVDADDCVSNQLAEFVNLDATSNGWFMSKGYDYREDVKVLQARNHGFHLRTNTSHIIRLDLLEPDFNLTPDQIKTGGCIFYHIDTATILKNRGTPLNPLPFRGTIYITDNGENMWWSQSQITSNSMNSISLKVKLLRSIKALYQVLIRRPIRSLIREEFGLYDVYIT
jgi:hypothetical protein